MFFLRHILVASLLFATAAPSINAMNVGPDYRVDANFSLPATQVGINLKPVSCNRQIDYPTDYPGQLCRAICSENVEQVREILDDIFYNLNDKELEAFLSYKDASMSGSGLFYRSLAQKISSPGMHMMLCSYIMQRRAIINQDNDLIGMLTTDMLLTLDKVEFPLSDMIYELAQIEDIMRLALKTKTVRVPICGFSLYFSILNSDENHKADSVKNVLDMIEQELPLDECITLIDLSRDKNTCFEVAPADREIGLIILESFLKICEKSLHKAINENDSTQALKLVETLKKMVRNANGRWGCNHVGALLGVRFPLDRLIKDIPKDLRKDLRRFLQKAFPNIYK